MPHNITTPTQVRRVAATACAVATPAATVVLALCATQALERYDRPHLVMMVYLMLLSVSLGGAIVASVAHCQITTQRAFRAGLQAAAGWSDQPPRPTPLRVVD